MRISRFAIGCALFVLAIVLSPDLLYAQLEGPRADLLRGNYEDAVNGFRRAIRTDESSVEAVRGMVAALGEVGRYEEAEEVAREFASENPGSVELSNSLGEMLVMQGRYPQAMEEFERALSGAASDSAVTVLNLAELRYLRGEHEQAMEMFDWFVVFYNRNRTLNSREVASVGTAVTYLAKASSRLFDAAIRAYVEAVGIDSTHLAAKVSMAGVLLDKLNGPEAKATLDEVLAVNPNHPGALLGVARWSRFDGSDDPMPYLDRALEVNPHFVEALALRGLLLLESEDYVGATEQANAALETNPNSVSAFSVLAAAQFLTGELEDFEATKRRVARISPRNAYMFNLLSEISTRNRLYREAVEFAQQAVETDSTSWEGYGHLGRNQLRIGLIEEGKANLEIAFRGDPFNVWNKNTLDLIDTFDNYTVTSTGRFDIAIETPESDLLSLYVTPLAEEAWQVLTERYGFTPEPPVRIEVMPTHADFSVRTVGLPGIGALGVSFGPVVAMDSPSARERSSFNWGSTLWHELVHTVTLGLTANRSPRWFAEGLAVYEERQARTGWGAEASLSFLIAYHQGKTPAFSDLNETFVRPSYPEQVVHSYYQSSVILDVLEQRFGWGALVGVMEAYRDGSSTDEAFRSVMDISPEDVDSFFDAYMEDRYGRVLPTLPDAEDDGPGAGDGFLGRLAMAVEAMNGGTADAAESLLKEVKRIHPGYVGPNSPYVLLSRIYQQRGDLRAAASELQAFTDLNEREYGANVALAELYAQLGDSASASATLDRAMYIYPYEIDRHRELAVYATSSGDLDMAVRERRAVVALNPVDIVSAHYELALAQRENGDRQGARRSVLRALELAPNFEEAQDLLLELRAERGGSE